MTALCSPSKKSVEYLFTIRDTIDENESEINVPRVQTHGLKALIFIEHRRRPLPHPAIVAHPGTRLEARRRPVQITTFKISFCLQNKGMDIRDGVPVPEPDVSSPFVSNIVSVQEQAKLWLCG